MVEPFSAKLIRIDSPATCRRAIRLAVYSRLAAQLTEGSKTTCGKNCGGVMASLQIAVIALIGKLLNAIRQTQIAHLTSR